MKILCTICARSGSKEVKNKNIIKIGKKILIDYTIDQARKSKIFDKIVVSTDSAKIKRLTRENVDFVIKRPKFMSNNSAPKMPAIKHALQKSEIEFNKKFDLIVDLDVTSPLRSTSDIKKAVKQIENTKHSNLVSVNESRRNPYFNMVEKNKNGLKLVKKNKKFFSTRQSSPKIYDLNASIYIWKRSSLLHSDRVIGRGTSIYLMPYDRSIDIDSKFDLSIVENILKKRKKK